jgi:hypothetical protein
LEATLNLAALEATTTTAILEKMIMKPKQTKIESNRILEELHREKLAFSTPNKSHQIQ